jgi:predicted metal-dependent phosphoesterase TrpH
MTKPAYPADLHTHSICSDGVYEPAELVRRAGERGVQLLALSDHDTLSGVGEAIAAGERLGVRVISAVELNTESRWGDVHVLGYFLDPADRALEERLRWLREQRRRRIELMVENLNRLGYPISLEHVQRIAAGGSTLRSQGPLPLGRPHLAQALFEAGHVPSYDAAFDTLISKHSPAYVERVGLSPSEAVRLIVERGGAASLAHPGTVNGLRELLPDLVREGLAGIEVYYPDHTPGWTAELRALGEGSALIPTGGSDFHGRGEHGGPLGGAYVPPETVARLEAACARIAPHANGAAERPAQIGENAARAGAGGEGEAT